MKRVSTRAVVFALFLAVLTLAVMPSKSFADEGASADAAVATSTEPSSEGAVEPDAQSVSRASTAAADASFDLSNNPLDISQEGETSAVTLSISSSAKEALVAQAVDSISIKVYMQYGGVHYKEQTLNFTPDELLAGQRVDLGVWGKFYADTRLQSGTKTYKSYPTTQFGVVASAYNIAPITATLPATYFALAMFDTQVGNPIANLSSGYGNTGVLQDSAQNAIPTVLFLMRPGMYTWDNLPENSYLLPYGAPEALTVQQKSYADEQNFYFNYSKNMQAYVRDLIEVSPHAHFNFFFGDHFVGEIFEYVYANNLSQDHYSVFAISDGTMSYSSMHATFAQSPEQNSAKLASMVASWKDSAEATRNQGKFVGSVYYSDPGYMLSATLADPHIYWLVARKALLFDNRSSASSSFDTNYISNNGNIIQFQLSKMFSNLTSDAQKQGLRKLFNLGDGYFGDTQGKPIMLFLGSTITGAEKTLPFEPFARATKAIFGDEYYYVYKGHPATPTNLYPDKVAQLETLGITDVDSSVPAELLLFFYPDLKLAGYNSSTYASAGSSDQLQMIYGISKSDANNATSNISYLKSFNAYFNKIDANNASYGSYVSQGFGSYVIEFSDAYLASKQNAFDFAMYNNEKDNLTYFKDGVPVSSTNGVSGTIDADVADGVYNIVSTGGLALDMPGYSVANGSAPLLWYTNDTANQRWYIEKGEDGYYTIKNVYSNKYLDVYGGNAYSGARIIQWTKTGADNQKWKIQQNGKGLVRIVSKLGNYSLDIQYNNQSAGATTELWDNHYGGAQRFTLHKIERASILEFAPLTLSTTLANTGKLSIDITAASLNPGAQIMLYPLHNAKNQTFLFSYNEKTGYYTIISTNSWQALDVSGAAFTKGQSVCQWWPTGGFNQMWKVENSDVDGSIMLSTPVGNYALDVMGANAHSFAQIKLWDKTGAANQRWVLDLNRVLAPID